jgi:hypothetical protein
MVGTNINYLICLFKDKKGIKNQCSGSAIRKNAGSGSAIRKNAGSGSA